MKRIKNRDKEVNTIIRKFKNAETVLIWMIRAILIVLVSFFYISFESTVQLRVSMELVTMYNVMELFGYLSPLVFFLFTIVIVGPIIRAFGENDI